MSTTCQLHATTHGVINTQVHTAGSNSNTLHVISQMTLAFSTNHLTDSDRHITRHFTDDLSLLNQSLDWQWQTHYTSFHRWPQPSQPITWLTVTEINITTIKNNSKTL